MKLPSLQIALGTVFGTVVGGIVGKYLAESWSGFCWGIVIGTVVGWLISKQEHWYLNRHVEGKKEQPGEDRRFGGRNTP
jgi:uncharacterized membrane protein (UPF0136 family)